MSLGPFARRTIIGGKDLSVGAAWTVYTSNDFRDMMTGNAVATDGLPFIEIVLRCTHATQSIRLALKDAGVEAVTDYILIGPGGTYTLDCTATGPTTISVQGTGAATTGHAMAQFRVGGGGG